MKRRHWLLALGGLLVLATGAWYWQLRARRSHAEAPVPDLTSPTSTRIRVEVLNATRVRGLARQATFFLRDRGFDVVSIGTNSDQRDSTVVIDRSNHPDWARRLAEAMGGARVESLPDSTLYVDLTVLVGRSWRPAAQPLHP